MMIRTKKSSQLQSPHKERTPTQSAEPPKQISTHLKITAKVKDHLPGEDEEGINTNSANSKGKNPYYFTFFNEKNDQPNNGVETAEGNQQSSFDHNKNTPQEA